MARGVTERRRSGALRESLSVAWWRLHADDRALLRRAAWVAAVLVVLQGLAWHALDVWEQQQRDTAAQEAATQRGRDEVQAARQQAIRMRPEWRLADRLDGQVAPEALLTFAQQQANEQGVTLLRWQWAEAQAATGMKTLQQQPMTVELQGPYPAIKAWLSELLARYPGLVVTQLTLTRQAQVPVVNGVAALQLLAVAP